MSDFATGLAVGMASKIRTPQDMPPGCLILLLLALIGVVWWI